jgi:hypothetical protein
MTEAAPPHPAAYSPTVLVVMGNFIKDEAVRVGVPLVKIRVLDPMAGIGRVHWLPGKTTGVEIEPEWARQSVGTEVGDATKLRFRSDSFDVIAVSPVYGNRMADHHEAKDPSRRRSYRHDLGRMPTLGSSGVLPFGDQYKVLHEQAWAEATRVLRADGLFLLNVSDFIRGGHVVKVAEWHAYALLRLGYRFESVVHVDTQGMRHGKNRELRVDGELIFAMRAP